MDQAIIRQGELVGRGIMAYETTEEVGVVAHLLVDVKSAKVLGLAYRPPGLIGRQQALDWDQLMKIGGDRIVIQTEVQGAIESQLSTAQEITNLEVWTDGGDHIGRVVDVCFDQRTGQVQQYLFALKAAAAAAAASPGIDPTSDEPPVADISEANEKTTVYMILPQSIISAGRKRVMIAEEDAQRAMPYEQPLDLSAAKASAGLRPDRLPGKLPDKLSEQLPAIPADFNELLQKGQSLAGQVTERVKQTAKRLTEEPDEREFGEARTLPEITEQLQEKTDSVRRQMQARLEKARDRAQDQLEKSGLEERLDKTLGNTSLGRSLGKQLDRFKRPQPPTDPIDVESFEVWEDD